VAAKALDALGVTFDVVREKVEEAIGANANPSPGSPPPSRRARRRSSNSRFVRPSNSVTPTLAPSTCCSARTRRRRGRPPSPERPWRRPLARRAQPSHPDDVGQAARRPACRRAAVKRVVRGVRWVGGLGPVRSPILTSSPGQTITPVGRDKESSAYESVTTHKNNPFLIGDPGWVRIVEGLAQKIVATRCRSPWGQAALTPLTSSARRG